MADLNPNILEMTLPIFRLNTPIKRDWGGVGGERYWKTR